jgi:hypothetical protein
MAEARSILGITPFVVCKRQAGGGGGVIVCLHRTDFLILLLSLEMWRYVRGHKAATTTTIQTSIGDKKIQNGMSME